MKIALTQAQKAFAMGEIPVGAVLCNADGTILAQTHNLCEARSDITQHAEILAIQTASQLLGSRRLLNCNLWVTLEPCPMCMAAIALARIKRVYFAAYDDKSGGSFLHSHKNLHHHVEIYGGIMEQEASQLLRRFFASKR